MAKKRRIRNRRMKVRIRGLRKRIFEIIEVAKKGDTASEIYDAFMEVTIVLSLIPLMYKESNAILELLNSITVTFFCIDYLLRLCTADYKLGEGNASFVIYPITPMAIIDLLSISPALINVGYVFKTLRLVRIGMRIQVFTVFRVFRAFRIVRYSKSLTIVVDVIRREAKPLIAVGTLAASYVLLSALVVFNVEPDTFNTFFDAVYWALISLTTLGYGDIYPVTDAGRMVTMISSFFGVAVVALPAGIITAGYMNELAIQKKKKDKREALERRLAELAAAGAENDVWEKDR